MKKNIFSILALLVVLGSSLMVIEGCKLKNPVEGFTINIKADAVTAPSELLIRDAKTGSPLASLTSATPVTISGPGAPYVYSSGATKTISIFQGAVSFSLRKGTPVSESNPIKFTIHIDIPGYLPLEYPISLTSLDPIQEEAYLVNFSTPPVGAASSTKSVGTGSDGKTTDTSSILIPATADKTEALTINIAAGTQMLDAQGQPVSGTVEAKVMQFTAGSAESLLSFPGGFDFSDATDANGNAIPDGGFEPAGWIDMTMSAGGKSVSSFDKPLNVGMEIDPEQINSKTNAKYKVGDEIEIYSKSAGGTWIKEGVSTIALNSNNKLEAQMPVKHLSIWSMGIMVPKCGQELVITANIPNARYRQVLHIGEIGSELTDCTIHIDLKGRDGVGVRTINTGFIPLSGKNYRIATRAFLEEFGDPKQNASEILYEGPLCGSIIPLGNLNDVDNMINNVFIKCENGSGVLLPDNYKVYYVSEDDYNNTINPATGRKIDPRDPVISGKDWKETIVQNRIVDGKTINTISIPKVDMVIGQKYRFSVYYNDGKKESREDYITPAPIVQEVLDAGGQDVIIVLTTCPL